MCSRRSLIDVHSTALRIPHDVLLMRVPLWRLRPVQLAGIQQEIDREAAAAAAAAASARSQPRPAPSAAAPASASASDSPTSPVLQRGMLDTGERSGIGFVGDPSTSESAGCFSGLRGLMNPGRKSEKDIREAIKSAPPTGRPPRAAPSCAPPMRGRVTPPHNLALLNAPSQPTGSRSARSGS